MVGHFKGGLLGLRLKLIITKESKTTMTQFPKKSSKFSNLNVSQKTHQSKEEKNSNPNDYIVQIFWKFKLPIFISSIFKLYWSLEFYFNKKPKIQMALNTTLSKDGIKML